jgi:hypothetical protein
MPKPSDLNLRPHEGPGERSEDQQRRGDMFVIQAEHLLDDDRFAFAAPTITRLRDAVKYHGQQPTERMWQALKNIEDGGRRQQASLKHWGRRYEGR